jgi:hypothetical protein
MTLDDMIAQRDALIAARFGGVRHAVRCCCSPSSSKIPVLCAASWHSRPLAEISTPGVRTARSIF